MRLRGWSVLAISLSVSGCLHAAQAVVDKTSAPQDGQAYLAASFSVEEHAQFFWLGFVDALGREYVMAISSTPRKGFLAEDRLEMIALPPGEYRLAFWSQDRTDLPRNHPLATPFRLAPGHVLFLGRFDARVVERGTTLTFSMTPRPLPADEASQLFTAAYPGFARAPLECLLCTAPAPGASAAAVPARLDADDFSRAHDVVIHFHRAEGYRDRGLHAWETFDDSAERRELRRATARKLMPATGNDDFGAFWVLNDLAFRNGLVNFAVREVGRRSDQSPQRTFRVSEGHEVWINDGDPKIYFSRSEAVAAQAR